MRHLLWLLLLAGGLAPVACSAGSIDDGAAQPVSGRVTEVPPTLQPDDMVNLTLYFRAGEGPHAHLERVIREVSVDQDLPRRALELLLAGPADGESNLAPALPLTTQIRTLEVHGGDAHVVLSPEAVRDAGAVGASPANEALALAAVANTLTEFPSVEQVRLEVEGQGIEPGEFWGGWGLPPVLVRDESLVGPPAGGEGVPELGRFTTDPQTTGNDGGGEIDLTNLRVRDRLNHVRLIIELGDPDAPDAGAPVPLVRARGLRDEIVLDLDGVDVSSQDLPAEQRLGLSDPAFRSLRVEPGAARTAIRLAVADARERRFWLHSTTGPTRIVLDVKK